MTNRLLLTLFLALGFSVDAFAFEIARTSLLFDTIPVAGHLKLQLAKDAIITDDTYIGFDPKAKTQYVFNEDSPYFPGYGAISFSSMSSDGIALAINRLPLPKHSETINLNVNAASDGIYKLNMTELVGIPPLFEIWLMDAYKKDSLDMRQNETYTFNLSKADTNSYGSKRFSMVIRQNPALGVHLLDFTAVKSAGGAKISWMTENEQNYTGFTVERSIDGGTTFSGVGGLLSNALGTYSFLDKNPGNDVDQYRLRTIDLTGTVSYSDVVTLIYGNLNNNSVKNNISIYPNPASNSLNLTIDPAVNSNSTVTQSGGPTAINGNTVYSIKVVSNSGVVMRIATTNQLDWHADISSLLPGTYMLQVVSNASKSFIGTSKFIKL